VFASTGYVNASVEQIVAGARVSRTAFYRFFENKEECMLAVFEEGTGRMLDALEEVAAGDDPAAAKIGPAVHALVETLANDPAMAKVILVEAVGVSPGVEAARHAARLDFARVIEEQLRASGAWDDHSPEELRLMSMATMAAVAEGVEYLVATDGFGDWQAVAETLTRYAQRALTPQP
jgi:AcrR family transcriptional regulator